MKKAMMATALTLALGAGAFTAGEARADSAEFFKCTMAEGGSLEALVQIGSDAEKRMAENGLENYHVAIMTPLFSSDLSEGTFYWIGVANDFAGAGMANDIWESSANDDIRARWDEQITGCESSSLHRVTFTPDEDEE